MGGKPCCISKIDDIYYFSVLFFSSLALYMWGTEIQNIKRAEGRMVHIEPLIFSSFNALDVFPFHIYLLLLSIRPTSRTVLWLLCTTAVCREKTFFCRECERREAACYTHSTTSCSIILLLLASRGNSPLFFSPFYLMANDIPDQFTFLTLLPCALKHSDSHNRTYL